ncbi:MAG: TetR/AcrR family transcriptional regulator [Pseudomonadales bacterium]|nr:TetR/AcrR family transcriptional regulator [Pseudomonadales bacterium]
MNDINRMTRKREKTRQALLDAARKLVFSTGHEKISIQDITAEADVGLGTFYNYFETKQKVFEAVLEDIRQDFLDELGRLRQPIKDPATLMAVTLTFGFQQAQDNEDWNAFLKRSGLTGDYFLQQDEEQLMADILLGSRAGRFKVDRPEFTHSIITGIIRHVNQEIAAGRMDRSAIASATRHILRMLGLPDLVTKALTQTPLPPVAAPKRGSAEENLRQATAVVQEMG